jgi:hypothetical protein
MRVEPILDRSPLVAPRRRVIPCHGPCSERWWARTECRDGAIPFSRYLEKHNRQDRDDTSRSALPLGRLIDVMA